MLKAKGSCKGKGGGKSKSGGVGAEAVTRVKDLEMSRNEFIVRLRKAVYNDDGTSRNHLLDLVPFSKFDRNGLSATIQFLPKLSARLREWAFNLAKQNLETSHNESGFGWDDNEKEDELSEKCARFLVVRKKEEGKEDSKGELLGFVHYRFSLRAEAGGWLGLDGANEGYPCVVVYDIHLVPEARRKGLGRHLMNTLALIARKWKMCYVILPVTSANDDARAFFSKLGYDHDLLEDAGLKEELESQEEFDVLSKCVDPALMPEKPAAPADSTVSTVSKAAESKPPKKASTLLDSVSTNPDDLMKKIDEDKAKKPVFTFGCGAPAAPATHAPSLDEATKQFKELSVTDEDADDIMSQLMEEFTRRNGREPSEEEVKQWVETLKEAAAEGLDMGAEKNVDISCA